MQKSIAVLGFLAAVAVGFAAGYAPEALALPTQETSTWYYSDASMTELVGRRYLSCESDTDNWGVITQHYRRRVGPCTSGGPTCTACTVPATCTSGSCQYCSVISCSGWTNW